MKKLFIFLFIFLSIVNYSKSDDFFEDITYQILENQPRLSYGVSVSDANNDCLLYTSPSPRDKTVSRMPSSA